MQQISLKYYFQSGDPSKLTFKKIWWTVNRKMIK